MYPFIRMFKELYLFRKAPRLPVTGTHVSRHRCWPWDIDFWMELNNGRTLTLYDLGRIPLAQRTGFMAVLRRRKWGLTVAGSCTRYRRRIRPFESFEMRSQAVGVDHRFVYLEQSMWKNNGECASHAMYRTAVTGPKGIVSPAELLAEIGAEGMPELPDHIKAWIAAEDARPWPPMSEG
ncbi:MULTISPECIES: acyl-CoA thioesterase [Marinovum]|jgi:acyl-CoA thioesterase FadM|uniref:acyl-CoA thioesterase n=1 Tax=Marinovum TaxID=367771 RepID=UPI00237A5335|nr:MULTISPECIES: acyl-CoA thioesterase [Marinovum]MDD9741283.1 acyl-CoA thioesterase [Marinovum sp. SP66]